MKSFKMKNFISFKTCLILSFSFLFTFSVLQAQERFTTSLATSDSFASPESLQSIFDELEDEAELKITLESNFTKLIENKNDGKYQPAIMSYTDDEGVEIQTALKVKARGKFRRKICDFPPLKLKFYKDDLTESGLSHSYKSIKLVTHCLDSEEEKQSVIKEYLAYKLYNELTPRSYEVKLVEVTYLDASSDEEPIVRFGFLIENTKEMSDRLEGDEIEQFNINLDTMDLYHRQVFSMFQFMIGNTDWKTKMMHNIKIVQSDDDDELMMVPYDFDFAGLVNTSYAIPNQDFKQQSVRQRIYMDKVNKLEKLSRIIRYFNKHKEALFDIVKNTEELNKKNKKDVLSYLKSFYRIINDPIQSNYAFVSESL
jgi:hypothetical protein